MFIFYRKGVYMMKKTRFAFILLVGFIVSLPVPAAVAQEFTYPNMSTDTNCIEQIKNQVFEIIPLTTCVGDGGVSRLNWLETDQSLAWDVDPIPNVPYSFEGEITITDLRTGVVTETFIVSCTEIVGDGICGDLVYPSGTSGGIYEATLTGTAYYWPTGLRMAEIVPGGCNVHYRY